MEKNEVPVFELVRRNEHPYSVTDQIYIPARGECLLAA
jgi:hypothetical protein